MRKKTNNGAAPKEPAATANIESTSTGTAVKGRRHRKRKKFGILKTLLILFLIVVAAGVSTVSWYVYKTLSKAPAIDPTTLYDLLNQSTVIYDDQGEEMDTIFSSGGNRDNVTIDQIPVHVQNAFIALEDKSFRTHHGFNVIRIVGAVLEKLRHGGQISGTSTITQQLARNLYLPDTQFDYDYGRKIIEAYYALEIENTLSKDEILEAYLNTIYYGYGCYGIEKASQSYFGKSVSDISIAQAAALATLPQAPNDYELVSYIDGGTAGEYKDVLLKETSDGVFIYNDITKGRRETCLKLMLDQGFISQDEYEEAVETPLKDMLKPDYNVYDSDAAYFEDYVIEEVISDLQDGKGMTYDDAWDLVYNGGLQIYSTMDSQAQSVVLEEFADISNYPDVIPDYDSEGNILNQYGQVLLYRYENYFDDDGDYILPAGNAEMQDDGSMIIYYGGDLNIYDTSVGDTTEYSLEFKNMYTLDENRELYAIQGGYINIPAEFKSRNEDGDLIISADFFKSEDYKDFMTVNDDGTVTIPPSSYSLRGKTIQPQAAMTIVENGTGHIKAMVGGRNTSGRMIYNRAINTRQPGSSIKPLGVYSAALQQSAEEAAAGVKHKFTDYGFDKQGADLYGDYLTAHSVVIDEKMTVNGRVWPTNFDMTYTGAQTIRTGMQNSLNTCAVKVWYQVGLDYSLQNIKNFGITTLVEEGDVNDLNAAALALGGMTNGVTTLEMASAYTVFPNNGVRYDTSSYTKVLDSTGKVILENDPEEHQVLDPGVAWIMADMLNDIVESLAANYAQIPGVFVGGKTGTTNGYYDDWFDGFTPNYTASLWIGNDYGFSLAEHSIIATYMWGNIMRRIDGCYEGSRAPMPSNVIYTSGEYFVNGTQSGLKDASDMKEEVTICKDSGLLATPDCKHTEKKEFETFGDDENKAPEYYCYLHNPDPSKYPIDPEQEDAYQEAKEKAEKEKEEEERKKKEEEERKKKEEEERKRREEEEKKQQEDPEPVDPEPVDPEPVDPEPVDPEPVDPEPDDPEPDDPNPDDPNPDDPNPDDPNPDDGGGGE